MSLGKERADQTLRARAFPIDFALPPKKAAQPAGVEFSIWLQIEIGRKPQIFQQRLAIEEKPIFDLLDGGKEIGFDFPFGKTFLRFLPIHWGFLWIKIMIVAEEKDISVRGVFLDEEG